MKRYYIENVKYGFAEIGISRDRVVTIKFKEGDKPMWLTMADGEGVPDTYLSDEDHHDIHVDPEANDDKFSEIKECLIYEFDGIDLCDYSDIFWAVTEDSDNPASMLIKYLAALVRCDEIEIENLIKMGIGRYADEVELPERFVKQIDSYYMKFPKDVDKKMLYEMRLRIESEDSALDLPDEVGSVLKRRSRTMLQSIKDRCDDEEDYIAWKRTHFYEEGEVKTKE